MNGTPVADGRCLGGRSRALDEQPMALRRRCQRSQQTRPSSHGDRVADAGWTTSTRDRIIIIIIRIIILDIYSAPITRRSATTERLYILYKKVKFSHTRYRALGPELIPVYRRSARSHPPGGRLPQLSARPAVTFPAEERHRPSAGTKLYCLVTEAHACEELAQGCYLEADRPRFEPLGLRANALLFNHTGHVIYCIYIQKQRL